MEQQLKAQVLKDIMKAMMHKDGSKLRPKAVSVSAQEVPATAAAIAPDATQPPAVPGMAHGGVVTDDGLHFGADSDISADDSKILESLYGGEHEGENEADEDEDEAGKE